MKNKYMIGEVSKLFNISTQTLRYYDKINLFSPKYHDKENNYRYYTIEQFEILDTIKYLKILGLSLNDIQIYLGERNAENVETFLINHKKIIERKIDRLSMINEKINDKIIQIRNCKNNIKIEKPMICYEKERKIIYVDVNQKDNYGFQLAIIELQKKLKEKFNFSVEKIGVIISRKDVELKDFSKFKSLYLIIDNRPEIKNNGVLNMGNYATIFHKGSYEKTYKSYEKLIRFLFENNYAIIGDSIEMGIIDSTIEENEEEFITRIQIPVKKLI